VVLVVVDGLRDDSSREMPYLSRLRETAAIATMKSGQPSFSKPAYAVVSSGAWQESTGVVLNTSPGGLAIDTVFRSARREELAVSMVAHEWWEQVNGQEGFSFSHKYGDGEG
jgi:predicted AlkP superfamily pyrophosphatase or phosphodiesterase